MRNDVLKIKESDGGIPVRIYAVDGSKGFEIHGAFNRGSGWHTACWSKTGLYLFQNTSGVVRSDLDITGERYAKLEVVGAAPQD